MVKTGPNECSMVLVSKVFLARVLGKCVSLRRTVVQKRTKKGALVVGNASAGGGVYQCDWRDSPLRGRLLGIQVWV